MANYKRRTKEFMWIQETPIPKPNFNTTVLEILNQLTEWNTLLSKKVEDLTEKVTMLEEVVGRINSEETETEEKDKHLLNNIVNLLHWKK